MCVVSMIMDHYRDKWEPMVPAPFPPPWYVPQTVTSPSLPQPTDCPTVIKPKIKNPVTQEEVNEFRRLLERAREYDRRNNEPDCELEEKKKAVRDLAEKLGVKVDFV